MKVCKKSFIYLFIMVIMLVSVGCNGESNSPTPNFNLMTNSNENPKPIYLEGDTFELLQSNANECLKNVGLPSISAEEVYENVILQGNLQYFVVDIRSAESFAGGHIEGAVNIPYNLTANPRLLEFLPKDKKIIVACYSGSTAGQTAMFWQLLGFNAYPLINGMGGWNKALWSTGGGTALPSATFDFPTDTDVPAIQNYSLPELKKENVTDLAALIMKRTQDYLNSGKGPVINAPTLKKALDDMDHHYYLVDIRSSADYKKGHIHGAINLPADQIIDLDNLKKIPTDKKIVLIGYTGTDASQIARVLNILGYDSYALLQGMRVWTSEEIINGIAPISTEVIRNFPVEKLNYDLEGGGGGTATCG